MKNFIKCCIVLLSMIMGFFHIYATIWFHVGWPTTYWAMAVVLLIAIATMIAFFIWCSKDK